MKCTIGNSKDIMFWSNKWVGNQSIKVAYLDLFALSNFPNVNVVEMGEWVKSKWLWNPRLLVNYKVDIDE